MATPTQTPARVQLVGRGLTDNNVFNEDAMMKLIASCDAPKDIYSVFSIIGTQSSGKSTLMNAIFNTTFDVMNASKGRGQTTHGIWASICNDPRAIVLDIEGTDGAEVQNDLGFENRSALFALVVSDVIFVNMWHHSVGLVYGIPLLANIFQERVKKTGPKGLPELQKTRIIFIVRDYDGTTPKELVQEKITSMVHEIWRSIPQTAKDSQFLKYFDLQVVLFPHYVFEKDKFGNKCEEVRGRIARGDLVHQRLSHLPVCDFPSDAKQLWGKIVENKALDIPSQREMRARTSCSNIMSKTFEDCVESDVYKELIMAGSDNPREFHDKLHQIIEDAISIYDKETKVYGTHITDEIKQTLKMKILHHAQPEFKVVMGRFKKAIIESTKIDVQFSCGKHTSGTKKRASSVVARYREEFTTKTEGLKFYHDLIDGKNFLEKLDFLGTTLAADIKKTNVRNLVVAVGTGVLTALAGATGGVGGVVLGAGHLAFGTLLSGMAASLASGAAVGTARLTESPEDLERSAHEIVERVSAGISNEKENTGAPSSSSNDQPR